MSVREFVCPRENWQKEEADQLKMNPLIENLAGNDRKLICLLERLKGDELIELVARLYREDRLFEYHYQKARSGGDLLENLREIYSQEHFFIDGWDFLKYSDVGDIVEFRKKEPVALESIESSKGVVAGFDKRTDRVRVRFDTGSLKTGSMAMFPKELILYGRKGGLFRREKRYPETRADFLKIKAHDLVKLHYRTNLTGYVEVYPGLRGSLTNRHPNVLKIVDSGLSVRLHRECDVHLILKNEINFDKLYGECYGGES